MSVYVTVGANDHAQASAFYDRLMPIIGWEVREEFPGWKGYAPTNSKDAFIFWVCTPFNGEPASAGNGAMIGFMARSADEVRAFYQAAVDAGGGDEGAPDFRPQYGPNWFAAYFRDPTGNKIGIVFKG